MMTRPTIALASATLLLSALSALFAAPAAANVPTGVHASSARAEAEAFAALEEKRDCDAARSFLRAHELAPDERLLVNAGLALERYGARAEALSLFERVRGTPAAIVADVDARITALEASVRRAGAGRACRDDVGAARTLPLQPAGVEPAASAASAASDADADTHRLLPAGIAAIASGLVVAGSTVGTFAWLELGVIQNADTTGDAKLSAINAREPVLLAGGSLAGALVVAGAVLVPFSLVQEQP